MTVVKNIISGLIIGVANIIPGVSGGTMMVILNIFDKILGAISDFRKDIKGNSLFLVQILLGAAIGIVLFSKAITYMLTNHPAITNMFFIGLILGSVPLVYRNATSNNGQKKKKISIGSVIAFLLALALLIIITFTEAKETTVNLDTINIDLKMIALLFFGGMIGSIAMIIPGVSGSFVMVLLGIYPIITGAIAEAFPIDIDRWFSVILPIGVPAGLGIIAGLIIGAKVIKVLLKHYTQQTYFGILGLLFGSLFYLFPTNMTLNLQAIIAILVALAGFALAYFSSSDRLKQYFEKKHS